MNPLERVFPDERLSLILDAADAYAMLDGLMLGAIAREGMHTNIGLSDALRQAVLTQAIASGQARLLVPDMDTRAERLRLVLLEWLKERAAA